MGDAAGESADGLHLLCLDFPLIDAVHLLKRCLGDVAFAPNSGGLGNRCIACALGADPRAVLERHGDERRSDRTDTGQRRIHARSVASGMPAPSR